MEARDEVQRVGEMADKSSRVKRTGQGGCVGNAPSLLLQASLMPL